MDVVGLFPFPLTGKGCSHPIDQITHNLVSIDLIELEDGLLSAFEFKYSTNKKVRLPAAFEAAYPAATFQAISRDNYLEWIS